MGLLNKRNIQRAKDLAFKNKDKIAAGVTKATGAVDKKTGGKHADKLKKLDDAAVKFAGGPAVDVDRTGTTPPPSSPPSSPPPSSPSSTHEG